MYLTFLQGLQHGLQLTVATRERMDVISRGELPSVCKSVALKHLHQLLFYLLLVTDLIPQNFKDLLKCFPFIFGVLFTNLLQSYSMISHPYYPIYLFSAVQSTFETQLRFQLQVIWDHSSFQVSYRLEQHLRVCLLQVSSYNHLRQEILLVRVTIGPTSQFPKSTSVYLTLDLQFCNCQEDWALLFIGTEKWSTWWCFLLVVLYCQMEFV